MKTDPEVEKRCGTVKNGACLSKCSCIFRFVEFHNGNCNLPIFEQSTARLHARPIVERLLNWNLPRMPNPVPPCWPGPLWYCHIPKGMSAIQGIRWVTENANDTKKFTLSCCTAYGLLTLPSFPFSWWFQMRSIPIFLTYTSSSLSL